MLDVVCSHPAARSSNVPTRHRPANPRLGVRVWPGLDKHNPYPYPAVPRGYGYMGTATRDNPYPPHPLLANTSRVWVYSPPPPPPHPPRSQTQAGGEVYDAHKNPRRPT